MVDPSQIEQVLMNLAVNARDAMPEGGDISIETRNVEIGEMEAAASPDAQPGCYVLLSVADTGSGMDEETRQHAFEPFFTTKATGEGTGLGLSTVYGIVSQSGGWISLASRPGCGCRFGIHLPRSVPCGSSPDADCHAAEMEGGGETVLVVEDQPEVRQLAAEVLRRLSYRVLEAGSGDEALLVSQSHSGPISLMVTDVVMPRMNGRELAGRLAPLRPEMRVLYISGYTADVIATQGALDAGVAYLAKPFTPEALAERVRGLLAEARP
jgi:CheY-like chemotaxis protein